MKKALSYGIRQNNSEFRIRLKYEMFDKFDSCLTFFKRFRTRNLSRLTYGKRYSSRTLEERSVGNEVSLKMKMKLKSYALKEECKYIDIPSISKIKALIDYSNDHPYD